jgi:hypothetical protein
LLANDSARVAANQATRGERKMRMERPILLGALALGLMLLPSASQARNSTPSTTCVPVTVDAYDDCEGSTVVDWSYDNTNCASVTGWVVEVIATYGNNGGVTRSFSVTVPSTDSSPQTVSIDDSTFVVDVDSDTNPDTPTALSAHVKGILPPGKKKVNQNTGFSTLLPVDTCNA